MAELQDDLQKYRKQNSYASASRKVLFLFAAQFTWFFPLNKFSQKCLIISLILWDWNIYRVEYAWHTFTILTIFQDRVQWHGTYSPCFRTITHYPSQNLLSSQIKSPYSSNNTPHSSLHPASVSMNLTAPGYLTLIEPYSICLFVIGLFHLAKCLQCSPCCSLCHNFFPC